MLSCPPQEECKQELNKYTQGLTGAPGIVMRRGSTDSSLLRLSDFSLVKSLFLGSLKWEDKHCLAPAKSKRPRELWIKSFRIHGRFASLPSTVQNTIVGLQQRPLPRGPNSLPQILICKAAKPWPADMPGSHALGPCPCRFISDAVTGVSVVTILFFFPSQKPSLKWWFDFKGKAGKAGASVVWSLVISGLKAGPS